MAKIMYAGLIDFQSEQRLAYFQTPAQEKPQYADELVMFMVQDGQDVIDALNQFIVSQKPDCCRQWKKTLFASFTCEQPPLLASIH